MRRLPVVRHTRRIAVSACAMLLMAAGCGPAPAPPPSPEPAGSMPAPPEADAQAAAPPAPRQGAEAKTKWVGDIPYDVFYDQPLVVAADASPSAPSLTTSPAPQESPEMPATATNDSPPAAASTDPATPAAGSGPDWAQLVSAEVLNDAVTQLRNRLTTNLNTLATYNRNLDAIVNDGACLAALAAVAEVHPDAVSWKDKARYVRDLGYAIYQNADGTGRGPYDATKEPFEQIVAILNGGPPPDIDAEANVPFADVADRSELMKRIKQSYDYLRAEINTESRFKESPEEIVREASVLAGFGGVISSESYDSADQEMYQKFIRDFMQANVDVVKATRTDDFAGFEAARNRIQQACDQCHGEYAFGTDSF